MANRKSTLNNRKPKSQKHFRRAFLEQLESRQLMAVTPLSEFPDKPIEGKITIDNPHVQSWGAQEFVTSRMIVRFAPTVTEEEAIATIGSQAPGASIKSWDPEDNMAILNLPEGTSREQVIGLGHTFLSLSNTVYAEPDFIATVNRMPNDPFFGNQWSLNNTGQAVPGTGPINSPFLYAGFADVDIDAVEAWDLTTGSSDVVVAVLDTGINQYDLDFQANFWTNPRETFNGKDDDGNGVVDDYYGYDAANNDGDPQDLVQNGHGTSVGSIISSPGDDGIGMTGVSWNSKVMHVKVMDDIGIITQSGIIGAYKYVTKMKQVYGVNIVAANMSYGGYGYSFAGYDGLKKMTAANVLAVATADNSSTNHDLVPQYPSGYELDGIICVTATNGYDTSYYFTPPFTYVPGGPPDFGYGRKSVDIAAPGIHVVLNSFPQIVGGFYTNIEYSTGTSFAAPHVAGVAALMASYSPGISALDIKRYMMESVDPVPSLFTTTASGGRLNAFKALQALPSTSITGSVFTDIDGDRTRDLNETGTSGWQVYLDLDNDSTYDANEPSATTAADGTYTINAGLNNGTYRVRQVLQTGFNLTAPNTNNGAHVINVTTRGQDFAGLNFGVRQDGGSIVGVKFLDSDGDGTRDAGEPGLAGILFYVDMNNNGRINVGEPASRSDANGNFLIPNMQPGVYTVREIITPGYLPTIPNTTTGGLPDPFLTVTVVSGQTNAPLVFGNRIARDWGDLPEGGAVGIPDYNTTAASNGPSHGILPGFMLGTRLDFEANGLPTSSAQGDDLSPTASTGDDEDGIEIVQLVPGLPGILNVRTTNNGRSPGVLQGWIDFNRDGDFDDAGEQILRNRALVEGLNTNVTFAVPSDIVPQPVYARFRYSYDRNLGPNGPAQAGEVEDYFIDVFTALPQARADQFPDQLFPPPVEFPVDPLIKQESVNNVLNVLRNDPPPFSGTLTIVPGSFPSNTGNGTISLDPVNQVLLYTPRGGVDPFTGIDTFTYRVTNGTEESAPATVQVLVTAKDPIAVDDTFTLPRNTSLTLPVIANDLNTPSAPISLASFTQPFYPVGTVVTGPTVAVDPTNPNRLIFTPPTGFVGTVQFQYTVTDTDTSTVDSTATVTMQVTNVPATPLAASYLAKISLRVFDDANREIGVDAGARIEVGSDYFVDIYSEDLRAGGSGVDRGVEAAFLDLLYDRGLTSVKFDAGAPVITFSTNYDFDKNAIVNSPSGIVNELGAVHNSSSSGGLPLGKGSKLVARVTFVADAAGSFVLRPDPAEDADERSQVLLAPEGLDPSPVAINDEQVFLDDSPTITIVPLGAPEFVNVSSRLDVNSDGKVTAFDALTVINDLNRSGARSLRDYDLAVSSALPPAFFVDANNDGVVSAFDALAIINHLNSNPISGGSGGEDVGVAAGEDTSSSITTSETSLRTFTAPAATSTPAATEASSSATSIGPMPFSQSATTSSTGSSTSTSSVVTVGDSQNVAELYYLTAVDELMTSAGEDSDGTDFGDVKGTTPDFAAPLPGILD